MSAGRPPRSFRLFVYGTLMRGGRHHDEYCSGVLSVDEGRAEGRRRQLPQGYPRLEVPGRSILAVGTPDPLADVATEHRMRELPQKPGEVGKIRGEILTFEDPEVRLPRLDRFEGFRPGGRSLYRRALIPVVRVEDGKILAAWCYVSPR